MDKKKIFDSLLLLFLFLIPWQTRWIYREPKIHGDSWEFGKLSIYGTDLLFWVLAVFLFIGIVRRFSFVSWRDTAKVMRAPAARAYLAWLLFVGICGISIVWSIDRETGAYYWFRLLAAAALVAMVLVRQISLGSVAATIVASGVVQALIALGQFFMQTVPANKWLGLAAHVPEASGSVILLTENERWLRAYGSLPHPNMLGGFLVFALLLSLYLYVRQPSAVWRATLLSAAAIMSTGLLFTFSRSAFLALIIALGLSAVLLFRVASRRVVSFSATVFVSVFIIALFIPQTILTRLTADQYTEVASIDYRLLYAEQAITLIARHPIGGVGFGNFVPAVYRDIDSGLAGYLYQPVHNIYLLLWAEAGLLALFFFGAAVAAGFFLLVRQRGSYEAATVASLLCAVLVIGLFDHYWFGSAFGLWMLGLTMALMFSRLKTPAAST